MIIMEIGCDSQYELFPMSSFSNGGCMMVLEDFEKFTKRGRSFSPKVSIRKRGQIGLNAGAVNKFSLEKYDYAILYISKGRDKIAIKLTQNPKEEGAIKIMKRTGNYSFSGKSFFDFYEIDYNQTRSFDAEWVKAEQIVVFSIE